MTAPRWAPVRAFTELLTAHACYASTTRTGGVLCLECLDANGNGQYPDTGAWAAHIVAQLHANGLTVRKIKAREEASTAAAAGGLF
jgi:hypothetical protein